MPGEVYLTRAGQERLLKELERLKNVERLKISKAIGEARLQGDLSENAEYDAAKEAQAHCEARIAELEGTLTNVRIIEDQNIPANKVYIGATVTVQDLDSKQESQYFLVSPEEAAFADNGLSVYSPVGKGLTGQGVGDKVEIAVPDGKVRYKVLKIERP